MKQYLRPALVLSLLFMLLCCVAYPLLIAGIGYLTPGHGQGKTIDHHGRTVGFEQIGQQFTDDRYFHGRPSAVQYNGAGSGGSNKGPTNPDYLAIVAERTDSFLAHNPAIDRKQVPAELVTASGSGLDPHLSPEAALVQAPRVARLRQLPEERVVALITTQTEQHWPGPATVHVLRLNIALDQLSAATQKN
ncbi:MAG: potassium-transporting ATPase subunit KdpC [Chitinophagaceae bacterium]|jgi:K+-transporting ATPase ATPase C chain|nr:potassium-transporting ATPase subunit KdpC [Chitinophagaceae bacterium]